MNPLFALGVNNEPIVRPRANNTHCPGVRGPRTTQIAPDSVYSILFAQLYKNAFFYLSSALAGLLQVEFRLARTSVSRLKHSRTFAKDKKSRGFKS